MKNLRGFSVTDSLWWCDFLRGPFYACSLYKFGFWGYAIALLNKKSRVERITVFCCNCMIET